MTPWNCIVCGSIDLPGADHVCSEEPVVELPEEYDI